MQVHLLELPLRDFELRVNDEILENEALEEGDDNERHDEEENGENDYGDEETKDADSSREDALADYLNADDTPDYLLDSGNGDDEKTANLPTATDSCARTRRGLVMKWESITTST